ncbi:MAG: HPr family phosphocarrier protein [Rhodospirillales bacterium]|nr:HPr family phosphocarrier protein [Rhodospirillales bacterium]
MSPPKPKKPAPLKRTAEILNRLGLHARPAAKFAKTANRFAADVTVTFNGETVSAHSVTDILLLAASQGSKLVLEATGPEAETALAALGELIDSGFGERQ